MQYAIVTAADSKYLPAACCTLLSCVGDGDAKSYARLFLLAYDVSAEDAEKAQSFLKSRGASTEIIAIGADRLRRFRIGGYISAATYIRLLLPEFFDDRWDRLLYLDADTRIMVPLQTLLDASLDGKPIGAVHDYLQYVIFGLRRSRKRLALRSESPYFNAGVLSFDWRATITSGLLERARAFAIESAHLCRCYDNDALNKAFEGRWTPLDPRWNLMIAALPEHVLRLEYPVRLRPYISHFPGPLKPWMASFPERYEPHRAWYRNVLRDSPWPHFAAPAHASAALTTAASLADRLKWLLFVQYRRLQATFERRSPAEATPAQWLRNRRKSLLAEALKCGETNSELENLLDLMIAEAAR